MGDLGTGALRGRRRWGVRTPRACQAGVTDPGVITGQFRLEDWTMMKAFLSAALTSNAVIAALHASPHKGNVQTPGCTSAYGSGLASAAIGGLILGAGMCVCAACPGTVYSQIGAGYAVAPVTIAGGLCGVLMYAYLLHDRLDKLRLVWQLKRPFLDQVPLL